MELLICPASRFLSVRPQIATWLVSKTSFVNGNLLIGGKNEDLNNFRELLQVKIV